MVTLYVDGVTYDPYLVTDDWPIHPSQIDVQLTVGACWQGDDDDNDNDNVDAQPLFFHKKAFDLHLIKSETVQVRQKVLMQKSDVFWLLCRLNTASKFKNINNTV